MPPITAQRRAWGRRGVLILHGSTFMDFERAELIPEWVGGGQRALDEHRAGFRETAD